MLFDKFLGFVERHFPEYNQIAKTAKLFVFEKAPHEFLPKEKQEWFNGEVFTLPFPVTAVEDSASLVIAIDKNENVVGLNNPRIILELIHSKTDLSNFTDSDELKNEFKPMQDMDMYILMESELSEVQFREHKVHGYVKVRKVSYIGKEGINTIYPFQLEQHELDAITKSVARNAITVMEELVHLSHPKYFVVEESPVKVKVKNKKFPRTHERPLYTVITANYFRKKIKMDVPSGSHSSPIPHERRKHLRKLTKESGYKEDRIIVISASWVGSTEKTIGNKRYRVIL